MLVFLKRFAPIFGSIGIAVMSVFVWGVPTGESQPLHSNEASERSVLMPLTTVRKDGNPYLLEGEIIGLQESLHNTCLLKLRIDHVVNFKWGTHIPLFPDRIGSFVSIRFDERFPPTGPMRPRIGEEVEVIVRRHSGGEHKSPYWWSNLESYYYNKDGQFYDAKGQIVAVTVTAT